MPTVEQKAQALEILRAGGDDAKKRALLVLRGEKVTAPHEPVKNKSDKREIHGFLDALRVPAEYLATGVDALSMPGETGKNFDKLREKYWADKNYHPGDLTAEINSDNPYIQTAVKTAIDIGADPVNLITLGAGPVLKGASKLIDVSAPAAMKAVGALGKVSTAGRISPEGMIAAREFSPVEQMLAKGTYKDVAKKFGEARDVGRQLLTHEVQPALETAESMTETADALSKSGAKVVEVPKNFVSSIKKLESVEKTLESAKQPHTHLSALIDRAKEIYNRGMTTGPELDSILDHIKMMKKTPLDNERAVWPAVKNAIENPEGFVGDIWNMYKESQPDLAAARSLTSKANAMANGRKGGALSEFLLSMPTTGGLLDAGRRVVHGDIKGGAVEAAAALLLKNPAAWNAVTGFARLAPQALESTSGVLNAAPAITQTLGVGANVLAQQGAGQGQAPMIDPKDADLMQKTGLTSVQGGIIQDQNEKIKFLDQIQHNPALNHAQKTKLRLIVIRTGRIPDPAELSN